MIRRSHERITHTLSAVKEGDGTGTVTSSPASINCGSDCSETYVSGTSVTLSAAAASGSSFAGWGVTDCPGTGTCTLTMNAAKTVRPQCTVNRYSLAVNRQGTGGGTVTSSPVGINCGSDCSEAYRHGMTAAPAAGSAFTGWGGDCTGTGTCTVSMTSVRTVTAAFVTAAVEVRADFNGDGRDDLAIGSPGEDIATRITDYGTVTVLYGSPTGLTGTGSRVWHQDSTGIPDSIETGDRFGASLAS